jgi:plastocyanin
MTRLVPVLVAAASLLAPATAQAGFFGQTINVGDFEYNPSPHYADPSTPVTWDWFTGTHSVTSYDDGILDSGERDSTDPDYIDSFDDPGRYEYFCTVHGSSMEGVISVPPESSSEDFPELDADGDVRERSTRGYTLGASALAVAPSLSLEDPDGDQIGEAVVVISDGKQDGDVLDGPAGSDYESATGELSVPGSPTDDDAMAALLRSVTFSTTGGTGTRRITFQAQDTDDDGAGTTDSAKLGNPDFIDVVVSEPAPADDGGGGGGGGGGGPGAGVTTSTPTPLTTLVPPAVLPAPRPLAPVLRLARTTFGADRRGRVTLSFTTDPNSRGTVELQALGGRARAAQVRRFARAAFRANARGQARVRLRLSASARRSLRRARTRRLRARLVVRRGTQSARRTITLRRR